MMFIRSRGCVTAIVAAVCMAVPASASAGALPATYKSDAAQSSATAKSTFPADDFRGGDSPVDHPGASRAATAAPTAIELVRPERTIVRNVDAALPLILSSTALLLVLAGLGITLVRTRLLPGTGRSR